ncbi:unnamed protein product [Diamesa serratosioi]
MDNSKSPRFLPLSPMRSPRLRRQFQPIDYNTHFPVDLFCAKPTVTKNLIGTDGHFRAEVDVHDFKGEEIGVKTNGHTILIECKHLEKEDVFGSVARSFTQKYILPPTFDMSLVTSKVSNGILNIIVPPPNNESSETRVISIKHE